MNLDCHTVATKYLGEPELISVVRRTKNIWQCEIHLEFQVVIQKNGYYSWCTDYDKPGYKGRSRGDDEMSLQYLKTSHYQGSSFKEKDADAIFV